MPARDHAAEFLPTPRHDPSQRARGQLDSVRVGGALSWQTVPLPTLAMPSSYLRPHRLDDALAALAERPRTVVAGGTDVYPALFGRPAELDVLDISGLGELRRLAL